MGFGAADTVGLEVSDPVVTTHGATPGAGNSGGHGHSATGATPFISSESLSDLARMAGKKRPLNELNPGIGQPRRRVLVYGSGVAAALLAVVSFQLMKATPGEHGRNRHAPGVNTQLFSPSSTLADANTSPPQQLFAPTPRHVDAPNQPPPQSTGPRPQTFDPNTAPEDPPPPPPYQGPGPMEPPSMAH